MVNKTYKNEAACPFCGKINDRHGAPFPEEERPPQPGDFSMCIGCGQIAVFAESMQLRSLTAAEMNELQQQDPITYVQMLAAAKALFAAREGNKN
jgi:hypothetical protein